MKHRAVRLSPDHLFALRTLARMEAITMSQAVRKAAILGSGGSPADADAVNAYMGGKERELATMLGPKNLPGRQAAGPVPTTDEAVVSARMPQPWNARLSARGAFATAVRAGIVRWGSLAASGR